MDDEDKLPTVNTSHTQFNFNENKIRKSVVQQKRGEDNKSSSVKPNKTQAEIAARKGNSYPTRKKPNILIVSNDKSDSKPLPGYKKDADALKGMWKEFGCNVRLLENARHEAMFDYISDYATSILTGEETFIAVFILSNGNYLPDVGDIVYGADDGKNGYIVVGHIIKLFDNENKKLQNIPKLFILQCCRGDNKPQGISQGLAAAGPSGDKLPQVSDILVMYATQPNDVAIVDPDGSWLIKAILEVFKENYEREHIVDMLTMVNRAVADQIVKNSEDQELIGVKCMSEIRFNLRYKLFIEKQKYINMK